VGKSIEIWFQDEARLGQKNGLTRLWAKKGTRPRQPADQRYQNAYLRPRQPADQRYQNAYLYGAICPAHGKGAALMLPWANTQAMQMHPDEISRHVARKAHGVVLMDRAGWHTTGKLGVVLMDRAGWHTTGKLKVPGNLTIILLPPRSPELNPVEPRIKSGAGYLASSMPDARLGTSSSQNPRPSHQSECENGHISVSLKCRWYHYGSKGRLPPMLIVATRGKCSDSERK
jgi:hypothetical protein